MASQSDRPIENDVVKYNIKKWQRGMGWGKPGGVTFKARRLFLFIHYLLHTPFGLQDDDHLNSLLERYERLVEMEQASVDVY